MEMVLLLVFGIVFVFIAILIPIALLSAFLSAIAKPKGKDLEFLTSSAPGERVLEYRAANACIRDAEPNLLATLIFKATKTDDVTDVTFAFIKTMTGGLWVGGRVFLTSHRVVFMPNAMNRAVHNKLEVIALNISDITSHKLRFGIVTKIADFNTQAGSLTVRCAKIKELAEAFSKLKNAL
jgi:hypothetical protein